MKKALMAAAALVALPVLAQAQSLQYPGFYVGVEGGVNWMLNTTILNQAVSPSTGFAAGGVIGYDFVGPRIEIEGVYRSNTNNTGFPGLAISNQINQVAVLANLLYDFSPGSVITPYIGAGAGIAFVDSNSSLGSTQFAYQGIVGLGWNVTDQFRVNLDGRYYGTTNPQVSGNFPNQAGNSGWNNNNFSVMLGLQFKFGAPSVVAPPLSLRRANTVKDALVRNGVPATAIAVIGRGEQGLLVQTADGVREPQNRRVEIVIQ